MSSADLCRELEAMGVRVREIRNDEGGWVSSVRVRLTAIQRAIAEAVIELEEPK